MSVEREKLKKLADVQIKRHTPTVIPPCRICGKELSIQALGGGRPTIWACSGLSKDMEYLPGRTIADKHYSDSHFEDRRHTDEDALTLAESILALLSELEQAERERDAAMRGLESLTPSGSEFVNDVKRCVEHVRERMSSQWELAKKYKLKSDASEAALRTLRQASADLQKSVEILAKKSIGYERDESIVMTMFLEDATNKANTLAAALAAEGGK